MRRRIQNCIHNSIINKKGMSLVELIAVMVISVVVVGAALVAFYGGSRDATAGTADAVNHSDAYLLESWLRDNLPTASGASLTSVSKKSSGAVNLYFASGEDKMFAVERANGTVMDMGGIKAFTAKTEDSGANRIFHYEITAAGGGRTFVLRGGVVMNNAAASPAVPGSLDSGVSLAPGDGKCITVAKP